jgi:phosphinothricin acetyltransferase
MPVFAPHQPDGHGRPDPDVGVRAARAEDAAGIVAVAATREPLPEDFGDRVRRWTEDRGRRVLVAERAGAVVAWAMLARWHGYDDVPDGRYVSALTVHPGSWRRGIGSTLLSDLLSASGGEVRSVVNARNRPSLALHARHGFREVRRAGTFAGIEFEGGTGVLLVARRAEDET